MLSDSGSLGNSDTGVIYPDVGVPPTSLIGTVNVNVTNSN